MKRRLDTIKISAIRVGDRLRDLDEAWVTVLAASIEKQGQLQPIVVAESEDGFALIAGLHRLAALKSLGRDEVDAQVYDAKWLKGHEGQVLEVVENLLRQELSALDRALYVLELKRLHQDANPDAGPGGDRKSEAFKAEREIKTANLAVLIGVRFDEGVAEQTGLSTRAIFRSLSIAENLTPDSIAQLRGTAHAKNQSGLVALSRLNADQQRIVCNMLTRADDPIESLADAIAEVIGRPQTDVRDKFVASFTNSYRRLRLQPKHQDALFAVIEADFVAWQKRTGRA
ncbi:MAG: ParB N-terminal domain-containing protein [Defluviimonas sp.]|nr:ParB N-terminal domain-containing protein [Rhodobiaceae bacterium]MCC0065408.1 ParB N-terminal domain-containing protein [Defluviimonas sp.]